MVFARKKKPKTFRRVKKKYAPKKFRRGASGAPTMTRVRSIQPWSDRYMCKIRFADSYSLDGANFVKTDYRGAGPYDPARRTLSHYPNGFYELATLYDRYICYGSKITVKFLSTGAGTNLVTSGRVAVVPLPQPGASTFTAMEYVVGYPNSRDAIVGGAGGTSCRTLKSYMSVKKIYGLTGSITNNPDCSSLVTAVPAKDFTWCVAAEAVTGSLNQIIAYVTIVYYVCFFDKKHIIAASVADDLDD